MNKIKFIVILFVFGIASGFAQQNTQITQYMYAMPVLNPAYSGSNGVPVVRVLGRTQWVDVVGAPRTAVLSFDTPIGRSLGLGLAVLHDRIGPVRENRITTDLSYTIFTGTEGRLAFGLKAGLNTFDLGTLTTIDPDPINVPINKTSAILGAGVFYYTDKFYAGFSSPNLLKLKYDDLDVDDNINTDDTAPFYLTSGYVFEISDNIKLKPSTMLKMASGSPISIDLSTNLLLNNNLEFGFSYRVEDSLAAMMGIQATQKFRVSYAYEYSLSDFGRFNSGTHELLLMYQFNRRDMKSPRFF